MSFLSRFKKNKKFKKLFDEAIDLFNNHEYENA